MALNPLNLARSFLWRVGFAFRESGQALERTGCRLQGVYSWKEDSKCLSVPVLCKLLIGPHFSLMHLIVMPTVNRHKPVFPSKYDLPVLGKDSFVAPSGLVCGKVTLGSGSSVWYNAVVRGGSLCMP